MYFQLGPIRILLRISCPCSPYTLHIFWVCPGGISVSSFQQGDPNYKELPFPALNLRWSPFQSSFCLQIILPFVLSSTAALFLLDSIISSSLLVELASHFFFPVSLSFAAHSSLTLSTTANLFPRCISSP